MSDSWTISVDATFLQRYPHSRLDTRLVDMVDPIKDGFDVAFGTGPLQDSQAVEQPALHRLRLQRATQAHDPFELSFSTLIGAFYEAPCEVITEKSARV